MPVNWNELGKEPDYTPEQKEVYRAEAGQQLEQQKTPVQAPEQYAQTMPNYNKLTPTEKKIYGWLPGFSEGKFGQVLDWFGGTWGGQALSYIDIGAEGMERTVGLAAQYMAAKTPQEIEALNADLKSAWHAGSMFADTHDLPMWLRGEDGGIEGLRIGSDLPGIKAVADARRQIAAGVPLEQIKGEYLDDLGALAIRANINDAVFHIVFDPLNYVMPMLKPVERLQQARKGILATKSVIKLTTGEIDTYTNLMLKARKAGETAEASKWAARLTRGAGLSTGDRLVVAITGGDPFSKVEDMSKLHKLIDKKSVFNPFSWFALTPESRAEELLTVLADNLGTYALRNHYDPQTIVRGISRGVAGSAGAEYGSAFVTIEGRTAQAMLKGSETELMALLNANLSVQDEVAELTVLADKLGLRIEELVTKIHDAEHATQASKLGIGMDTLDELALPLKDVPYSDELFRIQAYNHIMEYATKQSIVQFGVKSKGYLEKLSNFVKSGETLAFLRLSPGYAARNFMNNEMTIIARGLLGRSTFTNIDEFWDMVVKLEPFRLREGFGQVGKLVGRESLPSGVPYAARQLAKHGIEAPTAESSKILADAIRGDPGFLDKWTRTINNIDLGKLDMTMLASRHERHAAKRAFTSGYVQGMSEYYWKPGKFTQMGKYIGADSLAELRKIDPKLPEILEKKISSINSEDDLLNLLTENPHVSLDNILDDVAEQMGVPVKELIPDDMRMELTTGLQKAVKDNAVNKYFQDFLEGNVKSMDEVNPLITQQTMDWVEEQIAAEGITGLTRVISDQMDNFWASHQGHANNMSRLGDISLIKNKAVRSSKWQRILNAEDAHMKRMWDRFDASVAGMKKGLKKSETKVDKRLWGNLKEYRKTWDDYYKLRRKLQDDFFDGKGSKAKWDKVVNKLDDEYLKAAGKEDELLTGVDDMIAERIMIDKSWDTPAMGVDARDSFVQYREAVRRLRRLDKEAVVEFRKHIAGVKGRARGIEWKLFWRERYDNWGRQWQIERAGLSGLMGNEEAAAMVQKLSPLAVPRTAARLQGLKHDKHLLNAVNKYLDQATVEALPEELLDLMVPRSDTGVMQFTNLEDIPIEAIEQSLMNRAVFKGKERIVDQKLHKMYADFVTEKGAPLWWSEGNVGFTDEFIDALGDIPDVDLEALPKMFEPKGGTPILSEQFLADAEARSIQLGGLYARIDGEFPKYSDAMIDIAKANGVELPENPLRLVDYADNVVDTQLQRMRDFIDQEKVANRYLLVPTNKQVADALDDFPAPLQVFKGWGRHGANELQTDTGVWIRAGSEQGDRWSGRGLYKTVYTNEDNPGWVIKMSPDRESVKEAVLVRENADTGWFPEVYGVGTTEDGFYYSVMERVIPLRDPASPVTREPWEILAALDLGEPISDAEKAVVNLREAYLNRMRDPDIHGGNWGFNKNGDPVILDATDLAKDSLEVELRALLDDLEEQAVDNRIINAVDGMPKAHFVKDYVKRAGRDADLEGAFDEIEKTIDRWTDALANQSKALTPLDVKRLESDLDEFEKIASALREAIDEKAPVLGDDYLKMMDGKFVEPGSKLVDGLAKKESFFPDYDVLVGGKQPNYMLGADQYWHTRGDEILGMVEDSVNAKMSKPAIKWENQVTEKTRRELDLYLKQVTGEFKDAQYASIRFAEFRKDSALLNYNRRMNYNTYLGILAPFEFWTTQSIAKWAIHSIDRPAMLSTYMKTKKFLETSGAPNQMVPGRLKGNISLSAPFLPDWMGGKIFWNPLRDWLPFESFAYPIEDYQRRQMSTEGRAGYLVQNWLGDGEISEADAENALLTKEGDIWERAKAEVTKEDPGLKYDAYDFGSLMTSFHAPLEWAHEIYKGTPEEIQPFTPLARMSKGVSGMLGVEDFPLMPHNIEGAFRKWIGLPEFDNWEEYRENRMMSNMSAVDSDYPVQDILRAMIDREGEIYEEANRRADKEYAFSGVGSIFGMPLKIFAEGERAQRTLYKDYQEAWKLKETNPEAISVFFEKYPEVKTRMALFKEPEEQLRTYLVDEIWSLYKEMPNLHKRDVRDVLGEEFSSRFLDQETAATDEIPLELLQVWAKTMGGDPPGNYNGFIPKVEYAPEDVANRAQTYYDLRGDLFPDWWEVQSGYFDLEDRYKDAELSQAKREYREDFPWLTDYWDFSRDWKARNPDVAIYLTDDPVKQAEFSEMSKQKQTKIPDFTLPEMMSQVRPSSEYLIYDSVLLGDDLPETTREELETLAQSWGIPFEALMDMFAEAIANQG